jgi:hypothetical protein
MVVISINNKLRAYNYTRYHLISINMGITSKHRIDV